MSTSKGVNLPGIALNKKKDGDKAEGLSQRDPKPKAPGPPTLLRKNTVDPQLAMDHRREKGELPSLLNRSARQEPEIEKTARKADRSMEVKPTMEKEAEYSRGNSALSKELNKIGVSAVEEDDSQNQSHMLRVIVDKKEKDREKTSQELDEKMKLWNNIIDHRKKLYNKMIQDINAGHEADMDNDNEYNSKRKRQARKAALAAKMNKGGFETRIQLEKENMKNTMDGVNIEAFKTPEDYLNSQIQAIFNDTLENAAKIDYRRLPLYMQEYEKVVKTKKNIEQLEKDISDLRSIANGSSRVTK